MRVAFYAPMKPPGHAVPSGDRAMARALIQALTHGGAEVSQPSTFTSRDAKGDAAHQQALKDQATLLIPGIIEQGRKEGWHAWLTYHNYYKTPDLIGPAAAKALGIPYHLVEATRARKRLGGAWDHFAKAAEDASDAAHSIFYLTQQDAQALHRYAPPNQNLIHLRPFLARTSLPTIHRNSNGPMLSVGMMRKGAKLASYTLIAKTLEALPSVPVPLHIAGDGPAFEEVAALFAQFGDQVQMLGALNAQQLTAAYSNARLLLWPGVDEAFGMVYLEAQLHGVPVVAQDRPGVRDVLAPRIYPSIEDGASGLANLLTKTLADAPNAQALQDYIQTHHLLPAASRTLLTALKQSIQP